MSVTALESTEESGLLELRSRGLELVLSRIEFARWRPPVDDAPAPVPGKANLLELGAPLGANIAFLNGYRCRLYVADAWRALNGLDLEEAAKQAASALPLPPGEPVQAVFAWDLLSFLQPEVVTALAKALEPHCPSGTLLHALAYTGAQMPLLPAAGRMLPGARIEYSAGTPSERPNPRYSPVALERMLPGFRLRHSFLLPGGLQDYLFARE